MVGAHIAHDCKVGNNCVFANNATLAGHVEVGDWAILGGLAAVHQWSRIGCHSFIGGLAAVTRDLLPFGMAVGNRANLEGINLIGMRRRNFSKSEIDEVKKVYSILFNANDLEFKNKINKLKKEKFSSDPAKIITDFVNVETNRAYVSPTEI
jgi:Acyl-[acyl carrier protein]--UDP-N-acetylglucosamine O-acyltransferase